MPADTSEKGTNACDDGVDNDGDGLIDYQADGTGDPGCTDPTDTGEQGAAACDDGLDNDGDGKIDSSLTGAGDPGCSQPGRHERERHATPATTDSTTTATA